MSDTQKDDWETGLIGGPEKRVIEIVSYNPDWPRQFQRHAVRIAEALGDTARQIEHIGSTSVEGLGAKPIIDILVVMDDPANEGLYLPQMLAAGYELRVREPDFEEHRMFRTPERDVHVHFYPASSSEIGRYLAFRDFLRVNPDRRERYEALKRKLSAADWADMNEYANAKTDFIKGVIRADIGLLDAATSQREGLACDFFRPVPEKGVWRRRWVKRNVTPREWVKSLETFPHTLRECHHDCFYFT